MNQVQFFSNSDITALQDSVNEWLQLHPDIEVLQSDMNTVIKPDLLGNIQGIETYVFYILYTNAKVKKRRHALNIHEPLPATNMANLPTIDMPPSPGQASVANQTKNK